MVRRFGSIVVLLLVFSSVTRSDDATPLRVFYTGHSFHMFVPAKMNAIIKAAQVKEYSQGGAQGIGGSRVIQHWELAEEKNSAKKALTQGRVDVLTMAPHVKLPDEGIDHFVELGLKHNPRMRFLVQASWVPFDSIENGIRDNAQRDQTNLEALKRVQNLWRGQIEEQVKGLNKKVNREAVSIVPAGDAVLRLREMVAAGKAPGIAKQADLFTDPIGHGKAPVVMLVTYCNYVCITGKSPVGLKVNDSSISEELHTLLQKIAWETVTGYSMSGVKEKK